MRAPLPALLILLLPTIAHASFDEPMPGEVIVRDVPGTGRHWQEARSIVDAPPETVHRWLTEFEYWPGRFHDVIETRVLERNGDRARIYMRSGIMGRGMVLSVRISPTGIFYEGNDGDVRAFGRIFLTPAGDGRTDVIMQSSANVSGLLGALAPKSVIRERAREKLSADLGDLNRLARAHRGSARRSPPSTRPLATP